MFKSKHFFPLLVILFIFTLLLSFSLGRYPIDFLTLIKVLISKIIPIEKSWSAQVESVIFQIRMPRIILAIFIGAGLSLSGLVYQGLFQNPMVSPDVLGATSGAGFGAALALLLGASYSLTSLSSFLMGIVAVMLVLLISRKLSSYMSVLSLVLGGIMISSLFSSLINFMKLIADPEEVLPEITYFLMGSLSAVRWEDVPFTSVIITLAIIPIILLRWKLNVMTLGEEEARSLGINTKRVRLIAILSATLMSSVTVATAGMIGWIGLVIPHFARMAIGCDYRKTIPTTLLMGSTFLLLVDTISRNIGTVEVPLGILTSFIGAPFFLYLMVREEKKVC